MKRIKITESQLKKIQSLDTTKKVYKITQEQFNIILESENQEKFSGIRLIHDKNRGVFYLGISKWNEDIKEWIPYSENSPLFKTRQEACVAFDKKKYDMAIDENKIISEGLMDNIIDLGSPEESCGINKIEESIPTPSSHLASKTISKHQKANGGVSKLASTKITKSFSAGGLKAESTEEKIEEVGYQLHKNLEEPNKPHEVRPELKLSDKSFLKNEMNIPMRYFNEFKKGFSEGDKDYTVRRFVNPNTKVVEWTGSLKGNDNIIWKYNEQTMSLVTDLSEKRVWNIIDYGRIEEDVTPLADYEPQTVAQNEKTFASFNEEEDKNKIKDFAKNIIEFLKGVNAKTIKEEPKGVNAKRPELLMKMTDLGMLEICDVKGKKHYKVKKDKFKENIEELYRELGNKEIMLDEASEQEKNIFKIPSALVKRINDVNALIEKAKTDEVYAIEPDGTWESAYIFNPINVGKAKATISYVEPYHNNKVNSEVYDLRNQFRYNEFKYGLNWIIRSIKKGYRQEGKADMLKAAQSETNETTTAGSSGAFVGAMGAEPISRKPFKLTSENEVPKITTFTKKPNNKEFKCLWNDGEMAIVVNSSGKKYIFSYDDKSIFRDYANLEGEYEGKDEDGDPIVYYNDKNIELDTQVIEDYINDNYKDMSFGDGLESFEDNKDLSLLNDELAQYVLKLNKGDKRIGELLKQTKLVKTTSENKVPKITMFSDEEGIECKKMDETEVVDEETTASSSGQYGTPKMWAKSKKDMKFGKKPMYPNGKIVENKGKTAYPNGKFVEFDDCVKPGHSDVAENGGCSTGAIDNVVKTIDGNGSVVSKTDIYSEVAKKTGKTIEEVKSIIEKNIKKD